MRVKLSMLVHFCVVHEARTNVRLFDGFLNESGRMSEAYKMRQQEEPKERCGMSCSLLFVRVLSTLKLAVCCSLCVAIFHSSSLVLLHALLQRLIFLRMTHHQRETPEGPYLSRRLFSFFSMGFQT